MYVFSSNGTNAWRLSVRTSTANCTRWRPQTTLTIPDSLSWYAKPSVCLLHSLSTDFSISCMLRCASSTVKRFPGRCRNQSSCATGPDFVYGTNDVNKILQPKNSDHASKQAYRAFRRRRNLTINKYCNISGVRLLVVLSLLLVARRQDYRTK